MVTILTISPILWRKYSLSTYNDWEQEVKAIEKPLFLVLGDNDGLRQEHFSKLFTSKGSGKTGEIHGILESRMAILPGTSHSNIVKRADMLIPMITKFINTDLKENPTD